MSLHPSFRTASQLAERSLDYIGTAQYLITEGKPDDARGCLELVAYLAKSELCQALRAMRDDLAGCADLTPICLRLAGGSHYFTSAHEAITFVWFMVMPLVSRTNRALPSNLESWLGLDHSDALRAGIVRERARLLERGRLLEPVSPDETGNDLGAAQQ